MHIYCDLLQQPYRAMCSKHCLQEQALGLPLLQESLQGLSMMLTPVNAKSIA